MFERITLSELNAAQMEDLIALKAQIMSIVAAYKSAEIEIPSDVTNAEEIVDSTIKLRRRDQLKAELARITISQSGLMTTEEKRQALIKRREEIEKFLA